MPTPRRPPRAGLILATLAALAATAATSAAPPPASNKCALNHAVNISEVSLCGKNDWTEMLVAAECTFEKYRIVAGVYSCETGLAEARYFKTWPARLANTVIGQSNGAFEYIIINGLCARALHPIARTAPRANPEWGDIEWIAFCEPPPNFAPPKPWDEQLIANMCTGFTNIGIPKRACEAQPAKCPTWGKPGLVPKVGDANFGNPKGGSCELEEASKKGDNPACYSSPSPLRIKSTELVINEVDGGANRMGPDWIEVNNVAATDAEFRGCKIVTSGCLGAMCTDILPYTKTKFDFNIAAGGRAVFYENSDFVPPINGVDYIPELPTSPIAVSMCCEEGFDSTTPWSGDVSQWKTETETCTTMRGVGDTRREYTWGLGKGDPPGSTTCKMLQTKGCRNNPCYYPECDLGQGINITEISLCGPYDWVEVVTATRCNFDWMNIVLGVYDCEHNCPVDKYIYMVKDMWLGDKNAEMDYLTFQGFVDIKTGLPVDIDWGDVDYVALCERTQKTLYDPALPWDEQIRHGICTGVVNLFPPHADGFPTGCPSGKKPTVGRPGYLAPWDFYDPWTRSQKTGVCELSKTTKGKANSECRNSTITP
ncbi:hypothetical protein T492DRAFT_876451, partial [Pavlovales sp. CCMP2436]